VLQEVLELVDSRVPREPRDLQERQDQQATLAQPDSPGDQEFKDQWVLKDLKA